MANYYNMQEVMNKLRKTEPEVQEMIKQGNLRQYMDSGKPVFNVEDVDALAEEIVGLDITSAGLNPGEGSDMVDLEETSEVRLEPDEEAAVPGQPKNDFDLDIDLEPPKSKESEGGFGLSQMGDMSTADTSVGTVGINILSGTEDAYKLTEDTKAETKAADVGEIESLDADANLESFGSGSGLLDLSLQADDTSLGAVLDDILPAGVEGGGAEVPAAADQGLGLMEEPEDLLTPSEPAARQAAAPSAIPAEAAAPLVGAAASLVTVVPVDSRTNMYGIAMLLPVAALILAGIILTAAVQDIVPALGKALAKPLVADISLIWIISIGLILLVIVFSLVSAMGGGSDAGPMPQKEKAVKPKKEKPVAKKRK
ncbi:MAG: hypothetical protein L0Y36_02640 [Planctomycetales bacterium]|nr:hypothetical protein [Planctomycetales bacterium]